MNTTRGVAVAVDPRKAIAVLIAILSPWGIFGGVFGTILIPLMSPVAWAVYPVFDVILAYGMWWSCRNGGFEEQ